MTLIKEFQSYSSETMHDDTFLLQNACLVDRMKYQSLRIWMNSTLHIVSYFYLNVLFKVD